MLHVCLDMLCFCLLKSIAVATLFSQLLILKHFLKKIIKKSWNFVDFRKKSEIEKNLKILKISKISKIFLKIFHWKSYWKSKILKISKISIFRFLIRFSMENFQKYFRDFLRFSRFSKKSGQNLTLWIFYKSWLIFLQSALELWDKHEIQRRKHHAGRSNRFSWHLPGRKIFFVVKSTRETNRRYLVIEYAELTIYAFVWKAVSNFRARCVLRNG